jgi:hypothetical protein
MMAEVAKETMKRNEGVFIGKPESFVTIGFLLTLGITKQRLSHPQSIVNSVSVCLANWQKSASQLLKGRSASTGVWTSSRKIPKGFRLKAQGCEERATLGTW